MIQRLRRKVAALIAAGSLLFSPVPAMAQSAPAISQAFSQTAIGPGPYILLNGQSTCSISLNNSGVGLTMVPQVTSDSQANIQAGAAQWVTASTIGAGSISSFGVYAGNIASLGITAFRYNITALSSGTVSGNEACSTAVGVAGSGTVDSVNLSQVGGASVSLGQTTMSASIPVTIASNQSALPVTATGSGNFTVVQPTGTNLHAVLDTTSTTAVTQATGSNLHAQLDSGSTTAVTQATAANLNATVVGAGVAGTPSGGVVSVQGVASGTALPVSGTFFQATQPVSCSAAATCPVNASQVGGPWTQNLTQVGGSALALGQTTMSASVPVAIASNQSALTVAQATAANLLGTMTEGPASSTSGNTWNQTICNYGSAPGSTTCANVENNFPTDALGASTDIAVYNYPIGFNGSTWDRQRTAGVGNNVAATGLMAAAHYGQFNTTPPALTNGNYGVQQLDASSILLATTGGAKNTAIAAATAGPTVIKASAGRLVRVVITTVGTTGTETFYDNASACSGTVLGTAQGTTAVVGNVIGTILWFEMPAANGITACGGTGSAAVTVSYY